MGCKKWQKSQYLTKRTKKLRLNVRRYIYGYFHFFPWCPGADLNHRHEDFQSTALPLSYPGMEKHDAFGCDSTRASRLHCPEGFYLNFQIINLIFYLSFQGRNETSACCWQMFHTKRSQHFLFKEKL